MSFIAAQGAGPIGFWTMARQDPEHLALVAPDGTEITAGDLDSWAGTSFLAMYRFKNAFMGRTRQK